jgi:prevent-host-death family protein
MTSVTIREARQRFAAIVGQAIAGEVVILTRRGQEVARLVPPIVAAQALPGRSAQRAAMLKPGRRARASAVVAQRVDERS